MSDDLSRLTERASAVPTPGRREFLGGALGAAAVAAIPTLSGVASAHFPTELDTEIQPRNAENFVDLDEHDRVAVAVHPSKFLDGDGERTTFDPTERPVRYRFGARSALEDGEGARPVDDGEVTTLDGADEEREVLLLEFPVEETGLTSADDGAWLFWERDDSGEHGYAGFDTASVYGGDASSDRVADLLEALLRALEGR